MSGVSSGVHRWSSSSSLARSWQRCVFRNTASRTVRTQTQPAQIRRQAPWSSHQNRFFSSNAPPPGSKNHLQRQKRRRIRKKPSERPPTLLDRLRRRTPAPVSSRASWLPEKLVADEALLAERFSRRMDWARASLREAWKEASSLVSPVAAEARPQRYELRMDGSWWFWNLLLALSPALLIATYCELVAIPRMKKQEEIRQQEQVLTTTEASTQSRQDEDAVTTNGGGNLLFSMPKTAVTAEQWPRLLLDWWTGKEAVEQPESLAPTKSQRSSPSDNAPVPPPSQGQQGLRGGVSGSELEQIQALKSQLEALEARLKSDSPSHESETAVLDSHPHQRHISPMHQRRLKRQQQQQKEQESEVSSASTPSSSSASWLHLLQNRGWFAGESTHQEADSASSLSAGEKGGALTLPAPHSSSQQTSIPYKSTRDPTSVVADERAERIAIERVNVKDCDVTTKSPSTTAKLTRDAGATSSSSTHARMENMPWWKLW